MGRFITGPADASGAPQAIEPEIRYVDRQVVVERIVEVPGPVIEKIVYAPTNDPIVRMVEVPVVVEKEVFRDVYVDVPRDVIKTVTVVREVPVHVEKYIPQEVFLDREVIKEVTPKWAKVAIAALTLSTLISIVANFVGV